MTRAWQVMAGAAVSWLLVQVEPARAAGPVATASPAAYTLQYGGVTYFYTSCTGLGSETRIDQEEHGRERFRVKLADLVCTRALGDAGLWDWRRQLEQGHDVRLDVIFTIVDASLGPIAQWKLTRAWPRKLVLGDGTEEVSFQYDDFRRLR